MTFACLLRVRFARGELPANFGRSPNTQPFPSLLLPKQTHTMAKSSKTVIESAAQKSDIWLESEAGQKEIARLHARECLSVQLGLPVGARPKSFTHQAARASRGRGPLKVASRPLADGLLSSLILQSTLRLSRRS